MFILTATTMLILVETVCYPRPYAAHFSASTQQQTTDVYQ
jgi:hypothetical protein